MKIQTHTDTYTYTLKHHTHTHTYTHTHTHTYIHLTYQPHHTTTATEVSSYQIASLEKHGVINLWVRHLTSY